MRLARGVLWLSALVWAGFGLMLLVWPQRLSGVGLNVDNSLARVEVRGFYGGLELAIAALLGWSAMSEERVRFGLVGSALLLAGTERRDIAFETDVSGADQVQAVPGDDEERPAVCRSLDVKRVPRRPGKGTDDNVAALGAANQLR